MSRKVRCTSWVLGQSSCLPLAAGHAAGPVRPVVGMSSSGLVGKFFSTEVLHLLGPCLRAFWALFWRLLGLPKRS